jgi:membrane protein
VVSFVVIAVLFAFIFRVLPGVPLRWGDITPGAIITAVLFTAGKVLLGVYLGTAGLSEIYRAGGSLVVVLIWVY